MDYKLEAHREQIGQRIAEERRLAGYRSQSDFATALGLSEGSRQTIGNWESGRVLPEITLLLKMCKMFNCDLNYLLCVSDKKNLYADLLLVDFLSEHTDSHELCIIRQYGFVVASVWVDREDTFIPYLSDKIKRRRVINHEWGYLPTVDEDGINVKVRCHYIDIDKT